MRFSGNLSGSRARVMQRTLSTHLHCSKLSRMPVGHGTEVTFRASWASLKSRSWHGLHILPSRSETSGDRRNSGLQTDSDGLSFRFDNMKKGLLVLNSTRHLASQRLFHRSRRVESSVALGNGRASDTDTVSSTARIATWNVRGLTRRNSLPLLAHQAALRGLSAIGLAETMLPGSGAYDYEESGHLLLCSGAGSESGSGSGSGSDCVSRHGSVKPQHAGVGLLLDPGCRRRLVSFRPAGPRLLSARLELYQRNELDSSRDRPTSESAKPSEPPPPLESLEPEQPVPHLTIIQVYAPTTRYKERAVEAFYGAVESLLGAVPSDDFVLVMGDWNAKVGRRTDEAGLESVLGPFGLGRQNKRGRRLLRFCEAYNFVLANTLFSAQRHGHREDDGRGDHEATEESGLYTWTSPDNQQRNQIDYILVPKRMQKALTSCQACSHGQKELGSDHRMLVAEFDWSLL
ncbi:unnamed protein product [Protopolystoma xenopodis]|uniref:Endonuclease/exonuclease/phosphatase domain-containing protein n=1 Tax=Protopolystoma xenopodis TaxID=117903 RepID=A0A3S5AXS0_9PLAT|nr:unnamed protein product [Protopolystoma xenopodis]